MNPVILLLIDCTVKSLAIILACALATLVLRRSSAPLRHFVWLAALVAILAAPLVRWALPGREVALIPPQRTIASKERVLGGLESQNRPYPVVANRQTPHGSTHSSPLALQSSVAFPIANPRVSRFDWTATIEAAWACGSAAVVCYLLWGWVLALRVEKRSRPFEISLDREELGHLPTRCKTARILISTSDKPQVPMTWGVVRPVVMLPGAARHWPASLMDSLLLHELAHVRRFDVVSQSIAHVACALYWFNPAVWLAAKALKKEAEAAADDIVLFAGRKPSAYAADLLQVATLLRRARPRLPLLGVPAMKSSKIHKRVTDVLDPKKCRRRITVSEGLLTISAFLIVLASVGSLRAAAANPPVPEARGGDGTYWCVSLTKALGFVDVAVVHYDGNSFEVLIRSEDSEPSRTKGSDQPPSYEFTPHVHTAPTKPNEIFSSSGQWFTPSRLHDPAYRARLAKRGIDVQQIDEAEAGLFRKDVIPPQIAADRALVTAFHQDLQQLIKAKGPDWKGTITIHGMSYSQGVGGPIAAMPGTPEYHKVATEQLADAEKTVARTSQELDGLAGTMAQAELTEQDALAKVAAGAPESLPDDAQDTLGEVLLKVRTLSRERSRARSLRNSLLLSLSGANPEAFYQQELAQARADSQAVIDEKEKAEELFKENRISALDKETAEWRAVLSRPRVQEIEWDLSRAHPRPLVAANTLQVHILQGNVVDMLAQQCDVRDTIRTLFAQSGLSFAIAPEVQGTVTVALKNVPLDSALKNILRQVDSEYELKDGVYTIRRKAR